LLTCINVFFVNEPKQAAYSFVDGRDVGYSFSLQRLLRFLQAESRDGTEQVGPGINAAICSSCHRLGADLAKTQPSLHWFIVLIVCD